MIVNFWATWCGPCRREIPLLKELQKSNAAAGFQVVGVAVDFREDVLKYADEIGIDYPILIGEQDGLDAVSSFGLGSLGFPFTVFTDNQSRIVLTHVGELTREQSAVMLDAVNRGWVSISRPWHLLTTNTGAGNPHEATAEQGRALMEVLVERLSAFLVELAALPLSAEFPY